MKVHVLSRSGKELFKGGIELEDYATVRDLQREIYARTKWCYPSRQRLTLPSLSTEEKPTVLNPKWSLSDYCHKDNSENLTVLFKDLGHQVAYRTLMFLAYLGPLLVYPMFYYFPAVYKYFGHGAFETGAGRRLHPAQTYAMYYWCFHFSKRIVETYYLHRFSRESSPIYIVIRNCCHYWPFGVVIGYYMNHPLYTPPSDLQVKLGLGFGLLCQLANFYCHLILRGLRSCDGSDDYKIPRGFLFDMVTCANYTTEIYQWLGFSVAIQTVEGYAFLAASAYVMTACALPRHRRLKTLFDGKEGRERYPNRWVILPPFL